MKKVLILTGLSGSGKSTYARQFCVQNANWLRINRDDLRRSLLSVSLSEYWQTWPEQEKNRVENVVNKLQETAILNALAHDWHVLIDNTNLKLSYLNAFRYLLTEHFDAVEVNYQLIDVPIAECILRDKYRDDTVGEVVIRKQAQQLAVLKNNFTFHPEILTQSTIPQRRQSG